MKNNKQQRDNGGPRPNNENDLENVTYNTKIKTVYSS